MFEVNVAPDMSMYHLLKSQGYNPAYAIAEYVDNALQAHLSQRKDDEKIDIDIYIYSNEFKTPSLRNSVVIIDNGPGISKERLISAMKPAKPSNEKGLSEFGIGMKAASTWFSDTWSLSTKPKAEPLEFEFTFDLNSLIAQKTEKLDVTEKSSTEAHGTKITLSNVRKPISKELFETIIQELTDLYQLFTKGDKGVLNLKAHFDNTTFPLKYDKEFQLLNAEIYKSYRKQLYAIGSPKEWRVPIDMIFNGAKITGFIGILETGSYTSNPGLIMFRCNRVIQGTIKKPNIPQKLFKTSNKYGRQRVYGHLYADDLPVSYTKDKFEIDEDFFAEQLAAQPCVQELLKQTDTYRINAHVTHVATELDIPGFKTKNSPKKTTVSGTSATLNNNSSQPTSSGTKTSTGTSTTHGSSPNITSTATGTGASTSSTSKGAVAKSPTPAQINKPIVEIILEKIKNQTSLLTVISLSEEALWQSSHQRPIALAMCFRSITEIVVLDKIKREYASEYSKISDKGIKAVLTYLHNNSKRIFNSTSDHLLIRCLQSCNSGLQPDSVMLLNNTTHGHYSPSLTDIDRAATNLGHILEWAITLSDDHIT